MKTIKNPILKGFHPDPSIIRVGDDYYIENDEYRFAGAFVGAFVGLCCQDNFEKQIYADFDYFNYQETL